MSVARPFVFCCVALALLLAGVPSLGAAGSAAGPAACHSAANAPALHDTDCALGCDSHPAPESPAPDWAPASNRPTEDDGQSPACLAPAYRLQFAATPVCITPCGPRAPPGLDATTPVARHDILRD